MRRWPAPVTKLGEVQILVNNAGGVFSVPFLESKEKGWDALYRANLKHVMLCTHRVGRAMVAAGLPGSIINVTSIEGVRAAPGYAAYAAAKAGVINFTKSVALELGPPRDQGQRPGPRHHLHRGVWPRWPRRAAASASATSCPWGGSATSTRWAVPPCSSPPTSRQLRDRADHARRRRNPRGRRLVPPPGVRRLRPRAGLTAGRARGPNLRTCRPSSRTERKADGVRATIGHEHDHTRGESHPAAAESRLASPGMTTARSDVQTGHPGPGHVGHRQPHHLGHGPGRLLVGDAGGAAKPVSTGPGQRTVTVTPGSLNSPRRAWL